jgi:hypothetical protein
VDAKAGWKWRASVAESRVPCDTRLIEDFELETHRRISTLDSPDPHDWKSALLSFLNEVTLVMKQALRSAT